MLFLVNILIQLLPVYIFVVVVSHHHTTFKKLVVKNKYYIALIVIGLAILFVPTILGNGYILISLINEECSYKDLEILGYSLFINSIIALILGNLLNHTGQHKLTRHTKAILLMIMAVVVSDTLICIDVSHNHNDKVYITEVCRKEVNEYINTNGEEDDVKTSYVTIYNPNDYSCYYSKFYLSTDDDNLDERVIYDLSIPAKSSSTIEYDYGGLDISKSKNTNIYISSSDYNTYFDSVKVPALLEDEAYVLNESDGTWSKKDIETVKLTPEDIVEMPEFSKDGGFYDSSFDLYINVPVGTEVYYTTDSSDPTINSTKYEGEGILIYDRSDEVNIYRNISDVIANPDKFKTPSTVDKCFILRAIAVDSKGNASEIKTESYFINLNEYKNANVISLVSDPNNLFDEDTGIYVNGSEYDYWFSKLTDEQKSKMDGYGRILLQDGETDEEKIYDTSHPTQNYAQRGIAYERECNFEYYIDGNSYLNQAAGVRINGGYTRYGNQLKRLSVYSRKIYSGSKFFDLPLFGDLSTHSIVLRDGDINAFTHYLCTGLDVGTQNAIPVVVFLDGEYWYTTYMLDKFSEANIAEKYNIEEELVVINKNGGQTTDDIKQNYSFNYVYTFINEYDLSVEENYKKFNEMVDIQSYIDYEAIQIYVANMDTSEDKNVVAFHSAQAMDDEWANGKWHWSLYDEDLLTSDTRRQIEDEEIDKDYKVNSFAVEGAFVGNAINEQSMYQALKKNPDYCRQFVNSFMDLVNTVFSIDNVEEKLNDWGLDLSFNNYFFMYRSEYIVPYLKEEFNLNGNLVNVRVSTNNKDAGTISLNSIEDIEEYFINDEFNGQYFDDYSIDLSVDPNKGEKFDHWSVNGEYYSDELSITLGLKEGGLDIEAIYR